MAQCMRRDPAAEPRGLCRHVADAVELAHRYWPQPVLTRKQPASRPALQPPCAEQREKLRRQHGMPILAAFAQLDTDQHPLGIDVADPQHDDLAAAQTGAPRVRPAAGPRQAPAILSAVLYSRPGPGAASISRATCSRASTRGSFRG